MLQPSYDPTTITACERAPAPSAAIEVNFGSDDGPVETEFPCEGVPNIVWRRPRVKVLGPVAAPADEARPPQRRFGTRSCTTEGDADGDADAAPAETAVALRPYQQEACDAIVAAQLSGENLGLVSIPTGGGKSWIIGAGLSLLAGRALVVVHTTVLGTHLHASLSKYLGETVGLVSAGKVENGDARVVVALRQSLTASRLAALARDKTFLTLAFDEAHHAVEDSSYAIILEQLRAREPDLFVFGTTATPWIESGKGRLLCDRFWYSREIADLIPLDVLAPVIHEVAALPISLCGVRLRGKGDERDYSAKALEPELLAAVEATVTRVDPLIRSRRHIVVFAATVLHAQTLAHAFERAGMGAVAVWGSQRAADRARVMQLWREGEKPILVNVGVVSEGADFPEIDAIVFARPTASTLFYVQALGRGMRVSPGKANLLVIDCVGLGELRDPRQCVLDSIVPEVAALGRAPQDRPEYQGRKIMRDPADDVGRIWLRVAKDSYVLEVDRWKWLFTARDSSNGLWRVSMVNDSNLGLFNDPYLTEPFPPAPFSVIAGKVRGLIGDYPARFRSVGAPWRRDRSTPAQLQRLATLDPRLAQKARCNRWGRGRVSDAITVREACRAARKHGLRLSGTGAT